MNINRIKAESEGKIIADERSRQAAERAGFFAFFLLIAWIILAYYLDRKGAAL